MPKSSKDKTAFTLIEMLLVVSLLGALSVALYRGIATGLDVWERTQQVQIEEDIALALDRLTGDLRSCLAFSALEFEGTRTQMSFPTRVRVPLNSSSTGQVVDYTDQIGRVEYFYDVGRSALMRRQAGYGQALKDRFDPERLLARPIESLRFYYYYSSSLGVNIKSQGNDGVPLAVRVDIEYEETPGEIRKVSQIIHIPVGA